MKLINYLLQPLKILFLLLVIVTLIYFRNVIFLPHITQTVDSAQTYIEKELDISIPVYVNDNVVDPIVIKQADPAEVNAELCNNNDVIESESAVDAVSVEAATMEDVTSDSTPTETIKLPIEKEFSKEVAAKEVIDNVVNASAELDLLTQLTETVNALNSKVDKLFDEGKASVDAVLESYDKKQETVNVEATKSPVEEVAKENDDIKNVHLTEDTKKMFFMARQSYWMGDALAAENMYLKLADIEENNPDIYGELGNVYYTQGKWSEAGKAYYEAAVRLLDLDRNNQVDYLLRVIQGLDSDSAEKLKQKISS